MSDTNDLNNDLNNEQLKKLRLAKAFKLSKDDSDFLMYNYNHCAILTSHFRKNNSPKKKPIVCSQCGSKISLLSIICYNYTSSHNKDRKLYCRSCWSKKYIDVD